jgi:4,5-DOPA dioxygenase extradiol
MKAPGPIIFFGHGNPMNALLDNSYTRAWASTGASIARPEAILSISAHWYQPGVAVTTMPAPRTIHDFGGFPAELYRCDYPAPGNPALAEKVQALLKPTDVAGDEAWGLDHGTWAVLCHVFPEAKIPIVQLRIDETQPPPFHYALGRRLRDLRKEDVLIIGSGNIVHNLHAYSWGNPTVGAYDWASRFEARARELILEGEHEPLINYETLGKDALLSIPTPEHYLPLLYVLGASFEGEPITFPVEGMDGGSVSMLVVQFG